MGVYLLEKHQSWKHIELSVSSIEKLASCHFLQVFQNKTET